MPIVAYSGDDDYRMEEAVHALRSAVVPPAMASLCHKVLDNPSLAAVLEGVGGVSLALGGQTLVEIRNFKYLAEAAKDTSIEKQLDELKHLLETLEPTKTVFFWGAKLDGKLKFSKWLVKVPGISVQKFERLKFWETEKAAAFAESCAQRLGTRIAPDAAEQLAACLGTDLRLIAGEVEKIALYAHGRPITLHDVSLFTSSSDNLFLMMERWIRGEAPAQNYADLEEILLRRHPVEVFAGLQNQFTLMFRVMWLYAKGVREYDIAEKTGQKPFRIKKLIDAYRKVPKDRWLTLKDRLTDLEWRMKTGQLEGALALESLLGA